MPSIAPTLPLSDGHTIPVIGYGTGHLDDDNAPEFVGHALTVGYRLLDTAARYDNEIGVGRGIAQSPVNRADLMVTTKLRGSDHGRDEARRGLEGSLTRLGLDYVDLYLIHWPLPRIDKYVQSWESMIAMRDEGLIRSIGVSNFLPDHLDRLHRETGEMPVVNQIEMHPEWPQAGQRRYHADHHIVTEAWSPLRRGGAVLSNAEVSRIASTHAVSPGQVILRWHLQSGVVPIPYSSNRERVTSNFELSFELSTDEMNALEALNTGDRFGGDPRTHEEF